MPGEDLYKLCPICAGSGACPMRGDHYLCGACGGGKFVRTGLTVGQVDGLVARLKRSYRADGRYEELDSEQAVIERRIEAAREIERLRADNAAIRVELDCLEADRRALMAALDPLLVEVEPFRWAQTQEIERQVIAKQEWAERHNATCGNSNEMWFYSTEFRRSLEANLEPLLKAIRDANEVYDRIEADARAALSEVKPC